MPDPLSIFTQYMTEAPDDPPDIPAEDAGPPDIPDDMPADEPTDAGGDGSPPDIDDGSDMGADAPPDIGMDDQGDGGFGDDGASEDDQESEDSPQNFELDEKISAIMNMNLYQRFLSLLDSLGNQLIGLNNNSDVLSSVTPECNDMISSLKKLDENIRLYLKNYFIHENYSKNLLFFNKCLNLLKLLNDNFDKKVRKGIKSVE